MNKQTRVLVQYRRLVSDVKQYHEEKFDSFRVREDRLDHFLCEELIEKREFGRSVDTLQTAANFV